MRKALLKIMTLLVTLTLLATAAICPAIAAESDTAPKTLLALGDSLTTGYGLKDYTYGGDPYLCDSYINRIASASPPLSVWRAVRPISTALSTVTRREILPVSCPPWRVRSRTPR